MLLHLITVPVAGIAGTAAKDYIDLVLRIVVGTDVHSRTVYERYPGNLSVIIPVSFQCVVILSVVAAIDTIYKTFGIFHVCSTHQCFRCFVFGRVVAMKKVFVVVPVADALCEVIPPLKFTLDGSTEVVTAIDNIAYPWETSLVACLAATVGLSSNVYLGMSQDVGIAGTAKSIIDTSVTQVDVGVAAHVAFVTAAVQVLCFGNVCHLTVVVVGSNRTVQVYRAAVGWVEYIFTVFFLTYHTFLTAAIGLDGIALIQVHGGAAPDFGIFTHTGTEG